MVPDANRCASPRRATAADHAARRHRDRPRPRYAAAEHQRGRGAARGFGDRTLPAHRRQVELERLVGESLLAELDLRDDPSADTERHLLSFALQLQDFTAEHPGLASYLQVLFPRGDAGRRLLAAEVEALSRRGYSTDAAMVVSSAVATLAISLAAREENNANATGGDQAGGFAEERDAVADGLSDDPRLGAAWAGLPQASSSEFVRLLLAASIRGLVALIPPGRPFAEVVAELSAAGKDR